MSYVWFIIVRMGATLQHTDPMVALSRAHAALDELQALDPTSVSEQALLDYWRELERLRRRVPAVRSGKLCRPGRL